MSKKAPSLKESKLRVAEPKVVEPVAKPKPVVPNALNLSFPTEVRGFRMVPEALMFCDEIFDLLFDRFDGEMLKKKVEREFKGYSVRNGIQTCLNAINISNITCDKGDTFDEFPIHDFEPYNYDEESTEPLPPGLDSHGKVGKMGDPNTLTCRFRVSQFNKRFNAARDGNSSPLRRRNDLTVRFRGDSSRGAGTNSQLSINAPPSLARRGTLLPQSRGKISIESPTVPRRKQSVVMKEEVPQPKPYEIPEPANMEEERAEIDSMHKKLADFLKFKAQSKVLSRQFSKIAKTGTKSGPSMPAIGDESDSEEESGKRFKDKIKELGKVTFDFNGKLITQREPVMSKVVSPQHSLSKLGTRSHGGRGSSLSHRTVSHASVKSTHTTSLKFDPKKNLIAQFGDNLEEIYEAQEARVAKDDDSNFSNESFQRKKRKGNKIKTTQQTIKLLPTPMGDIHSISRSGTPNLELGQSASKQSIKASHLSGIDQRAQDESVVASVIASAQEQIPKQKGGPMIRLEKARYMRNPLNHIRLSKGILMKDASGALIGESDSLPRKSSRQLSIKEYANLKNSEGGLMERASERKLHGDRSASVQWEESSAIMVSRLKPDSAQQVREDIYINTRGETSLKADSPTRFDDVLGRSRISIQDGHKSAGKRKSSLPVISGVNQHSLSMLIDRPELLNQTPMARRSGFQSRNLSIGLPKDSHSGMLSPGYSSIVNSARREALELGGSGRKTSITDLLTPGRKKNSHSLLYGNGKQRSGFRLQIKEKIESAAFRDKVKIQDNAVQLIKNATRKQNPFEKTERFDSGSQGMQSTMKSGQKRSIIKLAKDKHSINQTTLDINRIADVGLSNTMNPRKLRPGSIANLIADDIDVPRSANSPTRML